MLSILFVPTPALHHGSCTAITLVHGLFVIFPCDLVSINMMILAYYDIPSLSTIETLIFLSLCKSVDWIFQFLQLLIAFSGSAFEYSVDLLLYWWERMLFPTLFWVRVHLPKISVFDGSFAEKHTIWSHSKECLSNWEFGVGIFICMVMFLSFHLHQVCMIYIILDLRGQI